MVKAAFYLPSHQYVAVKIYEKNKLIANDKVKECVEREIKILQKLTDAYEQDQK